MGTHPIFESDFDSLTDFKSVRNMASYKEGKEDLQTEQEQVHKIRITITSKNCAAIERISNELVKAAKDKQLKVKGPVRMPTKTLRITTRKTPNGEGSKTWDRFQMRIHKRVIDLQSPPRLCDRSPSSPSIPASTSKSPSATKRKHSCEIPFISCDY